MKCYQHLVFKCCIFYCLFITKIPIFHSKLLVLIFIILTKDHKSFSYKCFCFFQKHLFLLESKQNPIFVSPESSEWAPHQLSTFCYYHLWTIIKYFFKYASYWLVSVGDSQNSNPINWASLLYWVYSWVICMQSCPVIEVPICGKLVFSLTTSRADNHVQGSNPQSSAPEVSTLPIYTTRN